MRARRGSRASSVRQRFSPAPNRPMLLKPVIESLEERRLLAYMVGEYRFDEGAGTVTRDTAGVNTTHGTLAGNVQWTAGQFGTALDFNGGRVALSQSWNSYLAHQGTVSAWIRTTQVGGATAATSPGIMGANNPNGSDDTYFGWIDDQGRIGVQYGDVPGAKSPMPINDGQWHHVAFTRDRWTAETQVYVDGRPVDTKVSADEVRHAYWASIGAIETVGQPGAMRSLDAELDELRIYADVLSASEIAKLATRPGQIAKPAAPSNLTATQIRPDAIELRWQDNSNNEDNFELEVSTSGPQGPFTLFQKPSSFAWIAYYAYPEQGTTYDFRIRACNVAGCSDASNVASVTTAPKPVGHVGNGTGLSATYFDNINFTGATVTRIDPTVDFDWGGGSPDPLIFPEEFSAVWTGQVQAAFTEPYQFITRSDDGVRLYLNGQLIIDNWTDHPPTENYSQPIDLVAGQKYNIRMEWYERLGGATAQLMWTSPSTQQEAIPQTQLYPTSGQPGGLIMTITGNAPRFEGQNLRLTGTASGGQGPYTYAYVTKINGETYSEGLGNQIGMDVPDDGLFEVIITATDAAGNMGSATYAIQAGEVPPRIHATAMPTVVGEHEEVQLTLTKGDAPLDYLEWWLVDWGDGSDPDGDGEVGQYAQGMTISLYHRYADEGEYTITYTMKDVEGFHTVYTGPQYLLTEGMGTWHDAENEAIAKGGHLVAINSREEHELLIGTFLQDPTAAAYWIGLTDADEYTTEGNYVWSNGQPVTYTDWNTETGEPNNYNGPGSEDYVAMNFQTWFGHPNHVGSWNDMNASQFLFQGIVEMALGRPITIVVNDTEPDEIDVTIEGVPANVVEGQAMVLTPGGEHIAGASFVWTVTKDGQPFLDDTGPELLFTPDDNAEYVVTLVASRGNETDTAIVTIRPGNVAPEILGLGAGSGFLRGETVNFEALFRDPGSGDTHEVRYDFGDGTVTGFIPVPPGGTGVPAPAHVYERLGTYTVTVQVRDDDGAVTNATQTVTILPAIAMVNDGRTEWLAVAGTAGNDDIQISTSREGRPVVSIGGQLVDLPDVPNPERIIIYGRAGNDRVRVVGNTNVPVEVYGEAGNDDITGGPAGDILVGGAGDDKILGGRGRDILIGGAGKDQLNGQQDEDILIGESTTHDGSREALGAIQREWTRTDQTMAQRREHISAGGGLNGSYIFNRSTIINDNANDALTGDAREDWTFQQPRTVRAARHAVKVRRSVR